MNILNSFRFGRSPTILFILLTVVVGHLHAQYAELSDLKEKLSQSDTDHPDEVRPICDKILARDVVADFLADGTIVMRMVMGRLEKMEDLGSRIEAWKEELAAHPDSERLNYLLAIASETEKRAVLETGGAQETFPPLRLKVSREGATFRAEVVETGRNWRRQEYNDMEMPRTVYVGFFANKITAQFEQLNWVAKNPAFPIAQWEQKQISDSSTAGKVEGSDEKFQISGAGVQLWQTAVDDIFFVYQKLEGDGSLEATLQSLDGPNGVGMAGLMIRASLEPGAPTMAVGGNVEYRGMTMAWRYQTNEIAQYWEALVRSRPNDNAFIIACLEPMLFANLNHQAIEIADSLLKKKPELARQNSELFEEIYRRADRSLPEKKVDLIAAATPTNIEERLRLAENLGKEARQAQQKSDHARAVQLWRKMRQLTPNQQLFLEDELPFLVSLQKLNQADELRADLSDFFLGPKGGQSSRAMPSLAAQYLSDVQVGQPCLAPPPMLLFHLAARFDIAMEIARKLSQEKTTDKGTTATLAMALRLAAGDPATMALVNQGAATFLGALPPRLSTGNLSLLAFQLQQTPEGRKIAPDVILRAAKQDTSGADRSALLMWRARLLALTGLPEAADMALKEIVQMAESSPNPTTFVTAMQYLVRQGDLDRARKLEKDLAERFGGIIDHPYDEMGETSDLRKLHSGEMKPMPALWTTTAADETEIHWEFAPGDWAFTPERETRVLGSPVPVWDKRFTLEIYAVAGEMSDSKFEEEDPIAKLAAAGTTGTWKGRIPQKRQWLLAVLKDEQGKIITDGRGAPLRSPVIPAIAGENLLSPLRSEGLGASEGPWSSSSHAIWSAATSGKFPKEVFFISRLQPEVGEIVLEHKLIPVDPQQAYIFSTWMRGRGGRVGLFFLDANQKQLSEWIEKPGLNFRWTYLTHRFGFSSGAGHSSLPPGTKFVKVCVGVTSQCEIGDMGLFHLPEKPPAAESQSPR